MNVRTQRNVKKLRKFSLVLTVVLAFSVLISGVMTASRLVSFSDKKQITVVDLIPDDAKIKGAAFTQHTEATNFPESFITTDMSFDAPVVLVGNDPDFSVTDDKQIWTTDTKVEIFKISYDENGSLTVKGADSNKVIAPGTESSYSFALNNNGDVALDYSLEIEAYLSDNVDEIPVVARLYDYKENYLLGSDSEWEKVTELNGTKDSGVLKADYHCTYTLDWQWPFESGDDEFDTMLGNMAQDEELTLTVVIKTTATADIDPDGGDGQPPDTGYYGSDTVIWSMLCIFSFMAMIFILLWTRRSSEENDEE